MASGMDCYHNGHTLANRLIEACSLGLQGASLILDICIKVIDPFENKVSSDQYHMIILQAQAWCSSRLQVFF